VREWRAGWQRGATRGACLVAKYVTVGGRRRRGARAANSHSEGHTPTRGHSSRQGAFLWHFCNRPAPAPCLPSPCPLPLPPPPTRAGGATLPGIRAAQARLLPVTMRHDCLPILDVHGATSPATWRGWRPSARVCAHASPRYTGCTPSSRSAHPCTFAAGAPPAASLPAPPHAALKWPSKAQPAHV
jgi:hypothetical protein